MQITVYKCDNCNKEIGEHKHYSLSFGNHSGIAIRPKASEYWQVKNGLQGKFVHFCSTKCLTAWFDKAFKGVK